MMKTTMNPKKLRSMLKHKHTKTTNLARTTPAKKHILTKVSRNHFTSLINQEKWDKLEEMI